MGLQIWGKKWCDYLHKKDLINLIRSFSFVYVLQPVIAWGEGVTLIDVSGGEAFLEPA